MAFLNCTFLDFLFTVAKQVGHHSTKKLLSSRTRDSPFQSFVLTQKLPLYLRKKSHQSLIHAGRKEIGQSRIHIYLDYFKVESCPSPKRAIQGSRIILANFKIF